MYGFSSACQNVNENVLLLPCGLSRYRCDVIWAKWIQENGLPLLLGTN